MGHPAHAPAKRRHIRFQPDPLDTALIDLRSTVEAFEASEVALILDEAPMGGCGLVVKRFQGMTEGLCLRVKVGKMAPLHAVVRWIRPIDNVLVRIGLEFLE